MIRVYDLALDVVEDFTALLVDAVDARSTVKTFLLKMDEEGMNAWCPGAAWTTHRVVDSHNLFVCVSPCEHLLHALRLRLARSPAQLESLVAAPKCLGRPERVRSGAVRRERGRSPRALAVRASARSAYSERRCSDKVWSTETPRSLSA
jgi:hypothetical protein